MKLHQIRMSRIDNSHRIEVQITGENTLWFENIQAMHVWFQIRFGRPFPLFVGSGSFGVTFVA